MKTISIRVRQDFDHRLRIWAAHLDMNRSTFVRTAVREKVAQLEREVGAPQAKTPQAPPAEGEAASPVGVAVRPDAQV
jgi:predicted transcriptional regulator